MSKPNAKAARRRARLLLASCAIGLALGAVARAPQARAQSFDGTVVSSTNASVTTAPGATLVTVTAPRAVINWQPNDTSASTAPILFQPAAVSGVDGAFFTSTADYTVLNRILPTGAATGRAITLNGRVVSQISDVSSPAVTGGNVWFYSPGGIAIGASATFDVGSLLLSTLDVTDADLLDGNSSYSFDGAVDSTAIVNVSSGATINALNEGSYVAMIAPRVSQEGNVNVNGSAAYIGAEQVTIDMAGGLFAIDITRGTTINTPIAHLGTTTGPASTGADTHAVTMVAVPKNDAITLLVGGNLGYAAAGAGIVNGTVQIYAGYDIPNGSAAVADNGGVVADIALGGPNAGAVALSSDLTARASRDIIVASDASGAFFSTSNVTLLADRNASLTASNGFTVLGNLSVLGNRAGLSGQARVATSSDGAFVGMLDVNGDLLIDAQGFGAAGGGTGTGGTAEFLVTMGGASVAGQTRILADGFGGPGGGNGVGGTARLSITGGAADLGDVTISADGLGNGNANNPVLNGGDGIGGTAELMHGAGDLLSGLIRLSANGTGGENDASLPGGSGGDGMGGTVRLVRNGGDFVTSGLIMTAIGSGGAATATGGNATSGDALVALTATTTTLPFLSLDISATGGGATNGTNGGATGTGHAARVLVSGATTQFDITSGLSAIADATLGGNFSTGGDLAAAGIQIEAQTGASIMIDGFSNIRANATAFNINQQSGTARGGNISLGAAGGTINFTTTTFITANAEAGEALASGGGATGGAVTLFANGGGTLGFAADINVEAGAIGGRGDVGSNGTGGTILAFAEDGALAFSALASFSASGTAGFNTSGASPGTGTGGSVTIENRATAANLSSIALTDLNASALGLGVEDIDGFFPTSGDAGIATGGNVAVNLGGGTFTATSLTLDASGLGGIAAPTASGPASTGGDALGGTAGFMLTGGTATIGTLLINARGQGGDAADSLDLAIGALAGAGTGGTARLAVTGGTFDVASVTLDARGLGGDGTSSSTGGSSAGGAGHGGDAILDLDYDPVIPTLLIDASGIGGAGGDGPVGSAGGDGFGGAGTSGAYLDLVAGALTVNNATIRSDGRGGNGGTGRTGGGGNGGNGFGGDARINVSGAGAELTLAPDAVSNEASVTAHGIGGNAGTGAIDATGAGSDGANGGNGLGGNAGFVIMDGGRVLAAPNLTFAADGIGGNAVDGVGGTSGGAGGDGGAGAGGTAAFTINGGALLPFDPAFVLNWTINANGLGGVGGLGGDGSSGPGGAGGNGGAGRGGVARIAATNGIFALGSIFLDAEGFGGSGQFGAAGAAAGLGGDGFGGTAGFSNGDDGTTAPAGARSITFLDLRTDGTGGLVADSPSGLGHAGRVELADTAAVASGSAQIGALAAASRGLTGTTGAGFYLTSTGGALSVAGDATIDTGAVANFTFDGDGRLAVGNTLTVNALGDITITHANQPGAPVDSIGAAVIDFTTPGNFSADAASIVRGAATIDIGAGGAILLGNGFALDRITAHAGGDLTLGNAEVTGSLPLLPGAPTNGVIDLVAGDATSGFVPADITLTGNITASGHILVQAGRDIIVAGGASLVADNRITFRSGDDILVRAGAVVRAAANPLSGTGAVGPLDEPALLDFDAGAIAVTPVDPANVAAIIVDGTIGAPDRAVTLTAGAIQADASAIASQNFYAALRGVPAAGTPANDDGGQLRADCVAGNICLGAIGAGNIVRIGPETGVIDVPARISVAGSIDATDVVIRARDALVFTGPVTIRGADRLFVAALNGDIGGDGVFTLSGDGLVNVFAGGDLVAPQGTVRATGNLGLFANGGDIALDTIEAGGLFQAIDANGTVTQADGIGLAGALTASRLAVGGGNLNLVAANGITLDTLSVAGGDAVLEAANGAVSVGTDAAVTGSVTARGRSVTLNALSDLSVIAGEATAGDLTLGAGGTLAATTTSASGAITLTGTTVALGTADAGTTLSITAQGAASFAGIADAQVVTVRSGDIVIGAGGAIGSAGRTATIDLTNSDANRRTFIGGADNGSGYSLSSDEMSRLFANAIALSAPRVAGLSGASVGSSRAPDVIIGGFTLTGRAGAAGGNLGTGALRIATPGKLRVTGAMRLTGLVATNRLEISADEALEVDAAAGLIDLRDATGGLAGTLQLSSDDIIAASLQAIADVGAAATTDAIDDRLGINDGAVDEDGYLRADRIEVNARNGFYVQNSGASDDIADRRGFTVGSGGMEISTASAASRIVINGRQSDGAGGFVTGVDMIDLVRINGQTGRAVTGIDVRSTINGCLIASPLLCSGFLVPETPLSREIFEVPVDPDSGEDAAGQLFPLTLIELKDFEPFGFEPLIDEPVTGAGNEDLWIPECDPSLERCDN